MSIVSSEHITERLMAGIDFTAEELAANRMGLVSERQKERIQNWLRPMQLDKRPGVVFLAELFARSLLVAVIIAIPLTCLSGDLIQSLGCFSVLAAMGIAWLVVIGCGLWNKYHWTRLQRDTADGKLRIKAMKGKVKSFQETFERRLAGGLFNAVMPREARFRPDSSKFDARIGVWQQLVLNHSPVATYESGVEYRLYFVGSRYSPLVLSAEPL